MHGYLTDMDGVIYRGSEPIPGAVDFIDSLREQGIAYWLLPNNFAYTPLDVAVKLKKFSIETTEENVYTAAIAPPSLSTRTEARRHGFCHWGRRSSERPSRVSRRDQPRNRKLGSFAR